MTFSSTSSESNSKDPELVTIINSAYPDLSTQTPRISSTYFQHHPPPDLPEFPSSPSLQSLEDRTTLVPSNRTKLSNLNNKEFQPITRDEFDTHQMDNLPSFASIDQLHGVFCASTPIKTVDRSKLDLNELDKLNKLPEPKLREEGWGSLSGFTNLSEPKLRGEGWRDLDNEADFEGLMAKLMGYSKLLVNFEESDRMGDSFHLVQLDKNEYEQLVNRMGQSYHQMLCRVNSMEDHVNRVIQEKNQLRSELEREFAERLELITSQLNAKENIITRLNSERDLFNNKIEQLTEVAERDRRQLKELGHEKEELVRDRKFLEAENEELRTKFKQAVEDRFRMDRIHSDEVTKLNSQVENGKTPKPLDGSQYHRVVELEEENRVLRRELDGIMDNKEENLRSKMHLKDSFKFGQDNNRMEKELEIMNIKHHELNQQLRSLNHKTKMAEVKVGKGQQQLDHLIKQERMIETKREELLVANARNQEIVNKLFDTKIELGKQKRGLDIEVGNLKGKVQSLSRKAGRKMSSQSDSFSQFQQRGRFASVNSSLSPISQPNSPNLNSSLTVPSLSFLLSQKSQPQGLDGNGLEHKLQSAKTRVEELESLVAALHKTLAIVGQDASMLLSSNSTSFSSNQSIPNSDSSLDLRQLDYLLNENGQAVGKIDELCTLLKNHTNEFFQLVQAEKKSYQLQLDNETLLGDNERLTRELDLAIIKGQKYMDELKSAQHKLDQMGHINDQAMSVPLEEYQKIKEILDRTESDRLSCLRNLEQAELNRKGLLDQLENFKQYKQDDLDRVERIERERLDGLDKLERLQSENLQLQQQLKQTQQPQALPTQSSPEILPASPSQHLARISELEVGINELDQLHQITLHQLKEVKQRKDQLYFDWKMGVENNTYLQNQLDAALDELDYFKDKVEIMERDAKRERLVKLEDEQMIDKLVEENEQLVNKINLKGSRRNREGFKKEKDDDLVNPIQKGSDMEQFNHLKSKLNQLESENIELIIRIDQLNDQLRDKVSNTDVNNSSSRNPFNPSVKNIQQLDTILKLIRDLHERLGGAVKSIEGLQLIKSLIGVLGEQDRLASHTLSALAIDITTLNPPTHHRSTPSPTPSLSFGHTKSSSSPTRITSPTPTLYTYTKPYKELCYQYWVEAKFLRIKLARESSFRADLAYQKHLISQINLSYLANETATINLLLSMGIDPPTLSPKFSPLILSPNLISQPKYLTLTIGSPNLATTKGFDETDKLRRVRICVYAIMALNKVIKSNSQFQKAKQDYFINLKPFIQS